LMAFCVMSLVLTTSSGVVSPAAIAPANEPHSELSHVSSFAPSPCTKVHTQVSAFVVGFKRKVG
jgi:hypothetical protein